MSDDIDEVKRLVEEDRLIAQRREALSKKDLVLREHKVDLELNTLTKNQSELEQAKSVGFGRMTAESIENLVISNDEYMEAAKNAMRFINEEFDGAVPYFRKNLIVIGGDTGDGKSTTVANVVFNTIAGQNPATGKSCRVLVLSNEEAPEDFYNRITCFIKGWKYANHDQFTDEQRQTFKEYIPILAKDGRLTVIGDTYEGVPGWTTTVEGIETIFNNLIRDEVYYDAVIIDYYQNVNKSKVDPKLVNWQCQEKLCALLDQLKVKYPAPIIVMAQMKRLVGEDDTTPFNIRLKGSKELFTKATFVCELIPERKLLRSKWTVWKSRFTESVGNSIYTGFDKGKYVPWSIAFQEKVAKLVEANLVKEKEEELEPIKGVKK